MRLRLVTLPVLLLLAMYACAQTITHQATLNWNASSTSGVTYNVYRAPASGSPLTPSGIFVLVKNVSLLTYVDIPLSASSSFCYQVTATDGTLESTPAGPACGTTGKDAPSPPAGSVTVTFK